MALPRLPRVAGFALGLIAPAVAALAATPPAAAELQRLYDDHDWFTLREKVDARSPAFFRGAVAAAFHDLPSARRQLEAAIAADPTSDHAWDAQHLLVSLAFRTGTHGTARAQLEAMLRQRPTDGSVANALPLAAALAHSPDQALTRRAPVRFPASATDRGHRLPVAINGHPARYVLDSGANFSVLTESEARRCGLTIRDASTTIANVAGGQLGLRVAVADELTLGGARLTNVAFLVFRDAQQPFPEMAPHERGAIGIQVLLALGSLHLHRDGRIELGIEPATKSAASGAPLCFDNLYLVARAACRDRPLMVIVDTGARTTQLWPPFARALPELMTTAGADRRRRPHGRRRRGRRHCVDPRGDVAESAAPVRRLQRHVDRCHRAAARLERPEPVVRGQPWPRCARPRGAGRR